MKVRELKNFLELQMDETQIIPVLNSLSHWVNAIFQAKEYVTSNPKDAQSLRKLQELKVVEVREEKGQTIVTLNKAGQELYQDFYGHGYYL